jgi:hypothetical protein
VKIIPNSKKRKPKAPKKSEKKEPEINKKQSGKNK